MTTPSSHPDRSRSVRQRTACLPLAASLAVALLSVAAVVQAQGGTWGAVFTDAARTGSPAWVQPGTRIVSFVASASVMGSRHRYIEDPEGPYENKATGQRYRRTDETGESVGGGPGEGYLVVDVLSVAPDQVVGAASLYLIDRARQGALTYVPIGGGPEPAGAMDAVWLHPAILDGLATTGTTPGAEVLVGPYLLDAVVHEVVALRSSSQDVSLDRASGLVLVGTSNALQATLPVHLPGEDPATGSSLLTYQRLLGTRHRTVPGAGAPVPAWMQVGRRLVYDGSYTLGISVPSRTTLTVEAVGPDWARLHALTEVSGQGITSTSETWVVSGGGGPWWYDPAALAGMRSGEVIDEDLIVGVRTRVVDVGDWPGGRHVLMVTEGPGMAVWLDYDVATGVVIGYELHQREAIDSFTLTELP